MAHLCLGSGRGPDRAHRVRAEFTVATIRLLIGRGCVEQSKLNGP
ncbi:hypothetical protein [Streptomyces sp. NPDC039016]